MATVPKYFRDKLASEQTGPNSLDQSGVMIGQAVKGLADTFFKSVATLEAQQQKVLDESRSTKVMGEFSGEMLEQVEEIRSKNFMNPEEALRASNDLYTSLREKHLAGVENSNLRQTIGMQMDRVVTGQKVDDVRWKIGQQRVVAQKNYADTLNQNAQDLAKTSNYQHYLDRASEWLSHREDFYQVYGGVKQGDDVMEQGLEAYTRSFLYGKIERGESFEAGQMLARGDFDQFISPTAKQEIGEKLEKAYKGEATKSKFSAFNEAVSSGFDYADKLAADKLTILDIEEKLSTISFNIAKEHSKGDQADMQVLTAQKKQLDMLSLLRDAKLEQLSLTVKEDDLDTSSRLLTSFNELIAERKVKGKETIEMIGSLDSMLTFQQEATKAFYEGRLTNQTYTKWMSAVKAAVYRESMSKVGSQFWFNQGGSTYTGKVDKAFKKTLNELFKPIVRGEGQARSAETAIDAFNFYLDNLYDLTQGTLDLSQVGEDAMKGALTNAKIKASLKAAGLPTYLNVDDVINTDVGAFRIKSFNQETGEPVLDVPEELFK